MKNLKGRRLLSLLISICLVFSMFSAFGGVAFAAYDDHTRIHNGVNFNSPLDASFTGGILQSGRYYLMADIELEESIVIPEGAAVRLCLNGHILKGNVDSAVIINNGDFNIFDCGETTHVFARTENTPWTLDDSGTDTVTGGVITGGVTGVVNNGTMKLVKGNIVGNGGTVTGVTGGGICNYGELTLTGGIIIGNVAEKGAGLYNEGNLLIDDAALFTSNAATEGGGIYNIGFVKMLNGVVRGNTATSGGGIYNCGDMKLYGEPQVLANEAFEGGGIYNARKLHIYGKTNISENSATWGAGVCNTGMLTITAGKIENNTINASGTWKEDFGGAGIDYCGGLLTVGGTAYVYDNLTNGNQDNIYMKFDTDGDNKDGFLDNSPIAFYADEPLTFGAKLGVSHHEKNEVSITEECTNQILYFVSDDDDSMLLNRVIVGKQVIRMIQTPVITINKVKGGVALNKVVDFSVTVKNLPSWAHVMWTVTGVETTIRMNVTDSKKCEIMFSSSGVARVTATVVDPLGVPLAKEGRLISASEQFTVKADSTDFISVLMEFIRSLWQRVESFFNWL